MGTDGAEQDSFTATSGLSQKRTGKQRSRKGGGVIRQTSASPKNPPSLHPPPRGRVRLVGWLVPSALLGPPHLSRRHPFSIMYKLRPPFTSSFHLPQILQPSLSKNHCPLPHPHYRAAQYPVSSQGHQNGLPDNRIEPKQYQTTQKETY